MNSLSVDEVTISNTTRDPEVQSFQAILVFENFPANVAFEVFIRVDREEFMRIDGEEFLMGTASATKRGNNVHRKFLNSNINLNLSSKIELVDVIMRSSKDVARSTLDIYEFWGGELVFEDVKVIDNRN